MKDEFNIKIKIYQLVAWRAIHIDEVFVILGFLNHIFVPFEGYNPTGQPIQDSILSGIF